MELSKSLTFSGGPKGCHPKDHCFRKGFVINKCMEVSCFIVGLTSGGYTSRGYGWLVTSCPRKSTTLPTTGGIPTHLPNRIVDRGPCLWEYITASYSNPGIDA